MRIVSFYQLNEIQVMVFPHDDVAVIRDELKAAFKNLPSIKHPKECISIRFCYGFNRKTAYLIVNPTDKEIRRRIAKDDHPEAFLLKEDFDKWKASLSNA